MYTQEIIRHGPKNPGKHLTEQEALLDPAKIPLIEQYAERRLQDAHIRNGTPGYKPHIAVETHALPRNYRTAEIIDDVLRTDQDVRTTHPSIDDRLSPFIDHEGKTSLMPKALPEIWGAAEKDSQTVVGVAKEDRGLYVWAKKGLDDAFDGDGITLREIGYRIGDSLLDSLDAYDRGRGPDHKITVSNSGFIEPFMYATLDAMEQKGKDPLDYFYETGKALQPLQGIRIEYGRDRGLFTMTLPNGKTREVRKEVLMNQRKWLREHGKEASVRKMRDLV